MRLSKVKSFRLLTALAAALIITGCGSTFTPMPESPPPPPSTAVVVTPATATVYRGETQLFTAKVFRTGRPDNDMASGWQREHRQHGTVHCSVRF